MKFLIAALGLSGCERLLDLDEVDPPRIDASVFDGAGVGSCVPDGTHDEDSDGLPDSCDLCPTMRSDNSDVDGDGVGDQCDPRGQAKDKIDGFYPFADNTGLQTMGTVTASDDALMLDGASITTVTGFVTPERITVGIGGLTLAPTSATIVLTIDSGQPDAATCELDQLGCPGGAPLCIFTMQGPSMTNTIISLAPDQVESLSIYRTDSVVQCGVNDVTQFHSQVFPGPMPSGTVRVEVPIGPIALPNLIIYNVKP